MNTHAKYDTKKQFTKLQIFIFSLSLCFLIFLTAFTPKFIFSSMQLSTEEKIEDFNYMYETLKNNYPYFKIKERQYGYDWLSHKDEFKSWIKNTNNDIEFYNTMDRIVKLLQNGHTHIVNPDDMYYYKLENQYDYESEWGKIFNNRKASLRYKYWNIVIRNTYNYIPIFFEYVEGNYTAYASYFDDIPYGSVLKKVNSITVDEYVKSLMDKYSFTYDFKRKKIKTSFLAIYTKIEGEIVELTLETPDHNIIVKEVPSIKDSFENNDAYDEKNYETAILEFNKAAYLKIKSMDALDDETFYNDQDSILNFLKEIKDFPNLIIDIRGNPGGYDYYWMENIMKPIIKHSLNVDSYIVYKKDDYVNSFFNSSAKSSSKNLPKNKNYPSEVIDNFGYYEKINKSVLPENAGNFHGKIYLLVDQFVYSSAESFSAFCKATKFAELVGTSTGGDGIIPNTRAPIAMLLPNSKLIVRFSAVMALNPDGTANEETQTQPDIYVEQSYEDYLKYLNWIHEENYDEIINPYDTVLNKTLEIINTKK